MRRFLCLAMALVILVSIAVSGAAPMTGRAGALEPQEVRFRGRAVDPLFPPGCADCYEGWSVDVSTVLSGPPLFGRIDVITGGGIWGCVGGYKDPRILPRALVEVHGWLATPDWPYSVFVCGGSPDYYIRQVSPVSHRLFLPALFGLH
jgi:hypothetical protein